MGVVNSTFPRNIVKSQLSIFTPVGTAITIVMMPKKALTLAPAPHCKEVVESNDKRKKGNGK